jgi:hypothetical protein
MKVSLKLKSLLESSSLSKKERAALPFFVHELLTTEGKDTAISLGWFVDNWNKKNRNQLLTDPDGRRIIRFIRNNGLVPRVMADRYGYFVASNAMAYNAYIEMLGRKLRRLNQTYQSLRNQ